MNTNKDSGNELSEEELAQTAGGARRMEWDPFAMAGRHIAAAARQAGAPLFESRAPVSVPSGVVQYRELGDVNKTSFNLALANFSMAQANALKVMGEVSAGNKAMMQGTRGMYD